MSLSVDTMRTIDHRVGVPLCALATPFVMVFDWIKALFAGPAEKPRKLLFIELSEMGSAILNAPLDASAGTVASVPISHATDVRPGCWIAGAPACLGGRTRAA